MSVTVTKYRGITDYISNVVTEYIDAQDWLNLFPRVSANNELLDKFIYSYLNPVCEASLTRELYAPEQIQLASEVLSKQVYNSGIELKMKYEEWNKWMKMPGAMFNEAMSKIAEKPAVQMTQYFFTGEYLDRARAYQQPPITQYNFVRDQGSGSGSLTRPIPSVTSGVVWDSYADMESQINDMVGNIIEMGYNINDWYFFYPRVAHKTMAKHFSTTGDGRMNAFKVFADHGIGMNQFVVLENRYMPTAAAGSLTAPTSTDWDLIAVKRNSVLIVDTLKKFTNTYIDNSGTRFPGMTMECGMGTIPLFFPTYNVEDAKYYKGVAIIDGIGTDP